MRNMVTVRSRLNTGKPFEWLKQMLCALMAAVLVMGAMPPALAESGQPVSVDAEVPEDGWFHSAVMHEGRLLLAGDWLYEYLPGEETIYQLTELTPKFLEEAGLPSYLQLVGDGKQVYAFDLNEEGMIFIPVTFKENAAPAGGTPIKLPWGEAKQRMKVEEGLGRPSSVVFLRDQVHFLFQVWSGQGPDQLILSYQLKDGAQPRIRDAKQVMRIAPYQDDQLIALVFDEANGWDEVTQQNKEAELATFSLQDDSIKSLGSTGMPYYYGATLLYEPETDTLYMSGNAELLRKVGKGAFEVCAYLNDSSAAHVLGGPLFLLEPGKVMSVGGQQVAVRTTDPSQLPAVRLNVYGVGRDSAMTKAIKEMGGVFVRVLDRSYPSAQEFAQALLSGEDEIDLFILDSEYMDLRALQKKGYCLDLTGSQPLSDHVARLYPELREAGQIDGKLLMVAVNAWTNTYAYHPKVFKAMELEPPKTFFELCDLIERWNDGLVDEHADFTPFRSFNIKEQLTRMALQMFADTAQQQGEAFSFTDPLLKRMLERVESLRTDNLGMNINWESEGSEKEMQELYNKVSMVEESFDMGLYSLTHMQHAMKYPPLVSSERSGVLMPLTMTADEGVPFNVALRAIMVAVSAKSRHPEEAVRFLELYVKHLPPEHQATIMPNMNDAIPNSYYEENMKSMENHLESLKASIAKAEGAEKTELESQLKRYAESLEVQREIRKYSVTEEAVKLYRELMDKRYVMGAGSMRAVLNDENIQQALSRYLQKQMTLDQFLQDADGKLRLMRMENQ